MKFCDTAILALSPTTLESEIKTGDQSLDIVPVTENSFLDKGDLQKQGDIIFKAVLDFLGSQSITRYAS